MVVHFAGCIGSYFPGLMESCLESAENKDGNWKSNTTLVQSVLTLIFFLHPAWKAEGSNCRSVD